MPTISTSRGRRPALRPNQERGADAVLSVLQARPRGEHLAASTGELRIDGRVIRGQDLRARPSAARRAFGVGQRTDDRRSRDLRSIVAEQLDQPVARARNAALDRADGHLADIRRFFVRQPGGAHQDQRFALIDRQLLQRAAQIAQMQLRVVIRRDRHLAGADAVRILDLELAMAQLRVVAVAQDREQPRLQVAAGLELLAVGPRLEHRVLHQIVGARRIAAQRAAEGAQRRQQRRHLFQKFVVTRHEPARG